MNAVMLDTNCAEAEAVIQLYLLGGGASGLKVPPGAEPREALGGVVVQRIVNVRLFEHYCRLGEDDEDPLSPRSPRSLRKGIGTPAPTRYSEDVVWHGARLKQRDGDNTSLVEKLQSIAEQGFDPSRCMKGAAPEGGIWVATSPLESFGRGCDGLVAFVLCLAKTHFNEWLDSSCARVLQRERVVPLYSLVHA